MKHFVLRIPLGVIFKICLLPTPTPGPTEELLWSGNPASHCQANQFL